MIDAREFENIKTKLATLKEKEARAKGAIESIEADWLEKYGINDIKDITALLETKKAEVAENDTFIEDAYKQLKGVTNWALV